jgi:arylsulfatase A-like enzyme/GT2 family glycosyltransferase
MPLSWHDARSISLTLTLTVSLTILICTHNRADLLDRVLASLNAAERPTMPVEIVVAANACTDETVERLHRYRANQDKRGWLPLRVIDVPTPGKSHALNRAVTEIKTELTALVDDDHRVDANYLIAIEMAAQTWPEAGLYCGRILPDWDGTEPPWVHDEGDYRIYPLPIPRYEQGGQPKTITAEEGPIPGGGNLIVRRRVFELTGPFSAELGPHGHDLGGGEDSEFVLRALTRGVHCEYVPNILQFHYVDPERLQFGYLLKKAFQRTRSTSRIHGTGQVPLYIWRKLAEYGFHSMFSKTWAQRRFYLVRTAATLGELQGHRESGNRGKGIDLPIDHATLLIGSMVILTPLCGLAALVASTHLHLGSLLRIIGVAGAGTLVLLAKSLSDFSQTGPSVNREFLSLYRRYSLFALARLCTWALAIMLFTGGAGVLLYCMVNVALGSQWSGVLAAVSALLGILGAALLQFIRKLRFNPGLLIASMHYRMSRFYWLWRLMTPTRIYLIQYTLAGATLLLLLAASWQLAKQGRNGDLIALWAAALFYAAAIVAAAWLPDARPPRRSPKRPPDSAPNILMIGSDTLRADRLGSLGYRRPITPHIDALASTGTLFANCYVPCARTAPSLVSLLTGTWPHTHGIRDNFNAGDATRLKVDALPQLLKAEGYRTAAVSDWCGADMGKFSFGFDYTDLPNDQWNLKYFIRQGPKDLRLFISLFTNNRFGRLCIPELYYLGGVPLTSQMGRRARRLLSRLAEGTQPFFLNMFYSTTHPPFASEWPWYAHYTDPKYAGESKFAMAKLTDPLEIIRSQGEPRAQFDLDQILDLYDGCVRNFDDEVGRIMAHLRTCGLMENTIVVIYSDHGMEFFEHESWGQGNNVISDFSPRVPLIVADPFHPSGQKVTDIIRTVDIAPTLLELAGMASGHGMEGVSLKRYFLFDHSGTTPDLPAFSETGIWLTDLPGMHKEHLRYPDLLGLLEVPDSQSGTLAIKAEYLPTIVRAKDRMIRQGRWKLIFQPLTTGYRLSLFDMDADPECCHDLVAQRPEITDRLWQQLKAWLAADPLSDQRVRRKIDTTDCQAPQSLAD